MTSLFMGWLSAIGVDGAAAAAMREEGLDTVEDLQEVLDDPSILDPFALKTFDRLRLLRLAPAAVAAGRAGEDAAAGGAAAMAVAGCGLDARGWLASCGLDGPNKYSFD